LHIENKALVLDLVEWLASGPRPYADVMDAWRTSCPRLTIWEDAVDLGFVRVCEADESRDLVVQVTPRGREFLDAERPESVPSRRADREQSSAGR
jgi:hypothetical protein